MTTIDLTPARLQLVDDAELLALMAGVMALRVRTPEDSELLDACGREFRERKQPGMPDQWDRCAKCRLPAIVHDTLFGICPWDEDDARANAVELISPEEWERVRPHIFGQDLAA